MSSGINMVLEISDLQAIITFGLTGFSVTLPYKHFGNNTQGHCGKIISLSSSHIIKSLGWGKTIILTIMWLCWQEHATTTRLMTACYLEASYWKIVLWWLTIGLHQTLTNPTVSNHLHSPLTYLHPPKSHLHASKTPFVICLRAGRHCLIKLW